MNISKLMSGYFLNENYITSIVKSETPIVAKKSSWNSQEKTMARVFEFEKRKYSEKFLLELLMYNRETDADLEFRFKSKKVTVIIKSRSPYLSEIEVEAAEDIDKIRKDVMYHFADRETYE